MSILINNINLLQSLRHDKNHTNIHVHVDNNCNSLRVSKCNWKQKMMQKLTTDSRDETWTNVTNETLTTMPTEQRQSHKK